MSDDNLIRASDSARVLVVQRNELLRKGLALLLAAEVSVQVVASAGTGADAVDLVAGGQIDVVVTDLNLPDTGGHQLIRRIIAAAGDEPVRVVAIAGGERESDVYDALRAGADGYLLEGAGSAELAMAIRCVAAGDAFLSPALTRRILDGVLRNVSTVPQPRVVGQLTARENQVLKLIACGRTNDEIAEALVVAEPTVKSHINNIFAKLGVRDRAQAVVFSYEHALVTVASGG